jgi:hypothetical protein
MNTSPVLPERGAPSGGTSNAHARRSSTLWPGSSGVGSAMRMRVALTW